MKKRRSGDGFENIRYTVKNETSGPSGAKVAGKARSSAMASSRVATTGGFTYWAL